MQTPNQVGPAAQQQQPLQQTLRQHQQGMDRLRLSRRFMPYPQPYPLGPALLEAQMWLLGKLLSIVNPPTLLQVRHWSDVNMASFLDSSAERMSLLWKPHVQHSVHLCRLTDLQ
jgi:hypothetical protein